MRQSESKLMTRIGTLGAALTVLVILIDLAGGYALLEMALYDLRARTCQFFTPPPTDKLVHLDIDDRALESIGPWPWPRATLAELIDEVALVGADVIALDVLLSEAQTPHHVPQGDGSYTQVDGDALLASTLKRFGRALVPTAFSTQTRGTAAERALEKVLHKDPELTHEQALAMVKALGVAVPEERNQIDLFLANRRRAIFSRVYEELQKSDVGIEQLRQRLLPRSDPAILGGSPMLRLLESQIDKTRSVMSIQRFARSDPSKGPKPDDLNRRRPPPPIHPLPGRVDLPPILPLCEAAFGTGFVDYLPDKDGVVRSVPLWIEHRGQLYPQMGLAMACAALDVDPAQMRIEPIRLVIEPPNSQPITVPVRDRYVQKIDRHASLFVNIPWVGKADWRTMYDYPDHRSPERHVPISRVWDVLETVRRIRHNNVLADDALRGLLHLLDETRFQEFLTNPPAPHDTQRREELIGWTLAEINQAGWLEMYSGLDPSQLSEDDLRLINSTKALREVLKQNELLAEQLQVSRDELARQIRGRVVLMGWTATGTIADFVTTSLHAQCPGAVVHGAIFNAILTGELWWPAMPWVAPLVTGIIGLLTAAAAAVLSPFWSMAAVFALGAAYFILNGLVLFDYGNIVVGVAGPLTAIVFVWSGCMVARFVMERAERARITRRFQSYVDPALVNFVLDHPEMARLDGEVKELTVAFTDLTGFTALSERLREQTVGLLSEYMEQMVPIIRSRNGYVNKFLGDGIMFFFGAPRDNATHAADAVATVLQMHRAMGAFNERLRGRGLPALSMRVGLATGPMVVGDAGPTEASDYTVLGDTVNLAARLEPANKVTGTPTLINQGTAEKIQGHFLTRPIGKLKVVGKTEVVMIWEPLAELEDATPELTLLAEQTAQVVTAFGLAKFDDCVSLIAKLESSHGPSTLTSLYRDLCERYLRQPPDDRFEGQIILDHK